MTIKLGLTGSIGMGKSTTAGFFREQGVPVWDADAVVHELYAKGGAAVEPIGKIVAEATDKGFVDRSVLKKLVSKDPELLGKIETALSPILRESRKDFLMENHSAPLVLFDIPLLYETDSESWLDYVLVVTAPKYVQKQRVMERGTMDEALFETILSRQLGDPEKRALADFIFDTSYGVDKTKSDVKNLIETMEKENA